MTEGETMVLFRAVGQREVEFLRQTGCLSFPPCRPGQPFYPALHEEYAVRIARDWITKDASSGYAGYVTRFRVRKVFLDRFQVQTIGNVRNQEYWIPAEHLAEFNANLVGPIEVIAEFHGQPSPQP